MAKLIYSIKDIFSSYLNAEQKTQFNIPEYQRGFKWSDQQITELLNDINRFETNGDSELFYCLQNITIVSNKKNLSLFNVVDGQQRLTTIALLLSFLGESELVKNKINYSVRQPSNTFLQKVINNEDDFTEVILNKPFEEYIEEYEEFDYQDIFYMYSAIRTFDLWFNSSDENNPRVKESFKEKVLNNVKLIVNKVQDVSEQELFMNLNAKRVNLDGSDLVRAILITRVARQEMEEYDPEEIDNIVRINERRIRIGLDIDKINHWWSDENVIAYFNGFTKIKTGVKETIRFNQDLYPINLLYKLWAEKEGEKDIQLRYFESNSISNGNTQQAIDVFNSIMYLHRTLNDWYNDREIYHYLGYLFAQSNVTKFIDVWQQWDKKNSIRSKFIDYLKKQIKKTVFGKEPNDSDDEIKSGFRFWLKRISPNKYTVEPEDEKEQKDYLNWYEAKELDKFLILLDILELSKRKEGGVSLQFLNPKYFKKGKKEDKEHIFPSTPKELSDINKVAQPFETLKDYIKKLNKHISIHQKIRLKKSSMSWLKLTDESKNEFLLDLKDQIHTKTPINSIGNLVLLHRTINRGFGNDYYPDKRQEVINNHEMGLYVRQHTIGVFVKDTERDDLNNWTITDIIKNADKIANKLEDFFKQVKEERNV